MNFYYNKIANTFLPFVILFNMAVISCNVKKQQFVTTLTIEDTVVTNNQVDTAVMVLKKRFELIKQKGVTVSAEYKGRQIKIQSEILDKEWIKDNLIKKGALVFYECYTIYDLTKNLDSANKFLAGKIANKKRDTVLNPLFSAFFDFARPYGNGYNEQIPGYIGTVLKDNIPLVKNYISQAKNIFPADILMLFREQQFINNKHKIYEVFFLKNNDTKFFASNRVKETAAKTEGKTTSVHLLFDAYGSFVWKRMTSKNINKTLAIVIDDKILTAPNVMSTIEGGNSVISGVFEKKEAEDMADILRSGYLPLNLSFLNMQQIKTSD